MPTFQTTVSFRIIALLVFFVASLVASPPRAHPQSSDNQPNPPEVRVVVTAKRLPEPAARVAGHVTIVDRDQIESSNARTVVELLNLRLGECTVIDASLVNFSGELCCGIIFILLQKPDSPNHLCIACQRSPWLVAWTRKQVPGSCP